MATCIGGCRLAQLCVLGPCGRLGAELVETRIDNRVVDRAKGEAQAHGPADAVVGGEGALAEQDLFVGGAAPAEEELVVHLGGVAANLEREPTGEADLRPPVERQVVDVRVVQELREAERRVNRAPLLPRFTGDDRPRDGMRLLDRKSVV